MGKTQTETPEEELARLIDEQRRDDTPWVSHEYFVDMSLDAGWEGGDGREGMLAYLDQDGQFTTPITANRNAQPCALHGFEDFYFYAAKPSDSYCRICDREYRLQLRRRKGIAKRPSDRPFKEGSSRREPLYFSDRDCKRHDTIWLFVHKIKRRGHIEERVSCRACTWENNNMPIYRRLVEVES